MDPEHARPFVYFGSHTLTLDDEVWLKTNYSYPSGHTANYFGLAYILSDLRPERSETLLRRAEQGGISRRPGPKLNVFLKTQSIRFSNC